MPNFLKLTCRRLLNWKNELPKKKMSFLPSLTICLRNAPMPSTAYTHEDQFAPSFMTETAGSVNYSELAKILRELQQIGADQARQNIQDLIRRPDLLPVRAYVTPF